MTVTGITPEGEISLPAPSKATFRADEDAPADSLALVFPDRPGIGRVTGLKISGGTLSFEGIVDEQTESGGSLALSARSLAAVLLDNEALPQNYLNPSLGTIFQRHVAPYGFTGFLGDGRAFSGTLSVTKGMSEWQAAAAFCTRFLGVTPRVRGRVFDASGPAAPGHIFFGTGGTAYSSLEIRRKYSEYYSELDQKTGSGGYVPSASDAEAILLGIRRRRLLSNSVSDAAALLRQADRAALELLVTCPGPPPASLGFAASVNDPELGSFAGLTVTGLYYRLDGNGEFTRLTLQPDLISS